MSGSPDLRIEITAVSRDGRWRAALLALKTMLREGTEM